MSGRILVVEDTESIRYLYVTWLRRAGYDVLESTTGTEALARVDADVDVVVCDVNLPDMSGLDVCSRIKARPDTAGVPVMHVSATAVDARSRTEGIDRGADAYLTDPVDRAEYLATVRSLARLRGARRSAERLSGRLGRLAAATVPLNAADTLVRLLEAAAAGAADVFGAPALAVAGSETGPTVRVVSASGDSTPVTDPLGAPLTAEWQGPPRRVAEDALPEPWRDLLKRAGVAPAPWLIWPVRSGSGPVTAGLAVCLGTVPGALPPEEERIVGQLAESVSVALANLRAFTQEHSTALTLQQALLPERLPQPPGLRLAARYSASSEVVSVGGDFYDAFLLPAGRVAVVVGDVQGHSLQAAVVMAELRFSLRAFMIEDLSPARVVRLLNTLLMTYHPEMTATLVLAVLDADEGTLDLVNAGHLPPLLVRSGEAGAGGEFVEAESGVLLGVPGSTYSAIRMPFPRGTTLVLTTDGLVERRGQDLDIGLAELCRVATEGADLEPELLADRLVERFDVSRAEDDVAVMIVRRG